MDSAIKRNGRKWRMCVESSGATASNWFESFEECEQRAKAMRERHGGDKLNIAVFEYETGNMVPVNTVRL